MISRRGFLQGLTLGAGAHLLTPALTRFVREARGQSTDRLRLVVLTDGKGWGHQSMARNSPLLDPPSMSGSGFELPAVFSAFSPFADRVSIARRFRNSGSLHGSGWATLTGVRGIGARPGGISIDRFVARQTGLGDAFPSIALGVPNRPDRTPACTSADGPLAPFPALGDPQKAHAKLFGSADGGPSEASLLDRMMEDVRRSRQRLAGPERAKLDQLLDSYRSLEQQMRLRAELLAQRPAPNAPRVDRVGLNEDTVAGHIDVAAAALSFGLTHVVHLSVMGFDAHNAGWGFLGHGGDAHEALAHVSAGYRRESATAAMEAVIGFKAQQLARLYQALDTFSEGDETLATRTLFVWINSGGGKHHEGSKYHPIVTIGDAGGQWRAGQFTEFGNPPQMVEGLASIAACFAPDVAFNGVNAPLTELVS